MRRVAEEKGDSDVVNAEKSLKSLLSARANIMSAKAQVQRSILDNVSNDDVGATREELDEYLNNANKYGLAGEDQDGEGADDVYSKQIHDIREGDMKKLLNDIEACSASQAEKALVYADFDQNEDAADQFRQDLLKHLAGNIVVKEHRIRYQKE